jgi:hypothetical protein
LPNSSPNDWSAREPLFAMREAAGRQSPTSGHFPMHFGFGIKAGGAKDLSAAIKVVCCGIETYSGVSDYVAIRSAKA